METLMLNVGDKVPDFKLQLATAEGRKEHAFSEFLGKGDVLIAFYPLAFTGTCTKEMCETRDNLKFFEHVGATPFGFSTDTGATNVAFAKDQKLNFGIWSDPNFEVIDTLWESAKIGGVERRSKRGWMLIDAHGVVKKFVKSEDPGVWNGLDEAKGLMHHGHTH
ncbi:MAG: redoxin domain-containing protein [Thermoplasmatota archaeon]